MHRQSLPVLVALVAAGCFAAVNAQTGNPKKAHELHPGNLTCARACADCMQQCESCARHCADLTAAGKKETLLTLGTCTDCAEFCAAAARIVAHQGPMTHSICEACSKACDTCAAACEKHPNDEHMMRCAKSCRECARACREMMKHMAGENK